MEPLGMISLSLYVICLARTTAPMYRKKPSELIVFCQGVGKVAAHETKLQTLRLCADSEPQVMLYSALPMVSF